MGDSKSGGASALLLYFKLVVLLAAGNLLAWLIPCGTGFVEALANSAEVAAWVQAIGTIIAVLLSWVFWSLQTKQATRMQHQAIMPHLTFLIYVSRKSAPHIQINLLNNGLGPAIIRNFRASFDNTPINGGAPEFAHFLTDKFEKLLPGSEWDSRFTSIDKDDWISKDGTIELVTAETMHPEKFLTLFKRPTPQFNVEINRFRIDVEYESVFKEKVFETAPWKLEFTDPDQEE